MVKQLFSRCALYPREVARVPEPDPSITTSVRGLAAASREQKKRYQLQQREHQHLAPATLQHSFLLVRYFGQRSDNRTMEQYDGTHSVKTCLSSVICIVQYTSHNISPYKIREMLNATSSFRAL